MMNKELLFLNPCIKDTIWGGSLIKEKYGYDGAGDSTGESWGISAHPNGDCVISDGEFKGKTLSYLYENHRELFGGCKAKEFPLLTKIIHAEDKLSIQVHPDDEYAQKKENYPYGKKECWYIIDCKENASLVVGNNAGSKEELREMITNREFDRLISRVSIKKGDFVQIDPGTMHAITEGCLILETQQNSDITYRVYDYDRLSDGKPRPLHVEQSIDCIKVPDSFDEDKVVHTQSMDCNKSVQLIENDCYTVWKLKVDGACEIKLDNPFTLVTVIEGEGFVNGCRLEQGTNFIVPSGYGMTKYEGTMELILSAPFAE